MATNTTTFGPVMKKFYVGNRRKAILRRLGRKGMNKAFARMDARKERR